VKTTVVLASVALAFLTAQAQQSDPSAVVDRCYRMHFKPNMIFTEATLKLKRMWLAPGLYSLLLNELHKPSDPDIVPTIDGDPFTDSQEYPSAFTIAGSTTRSDTARVSLAFTGQKHGVTVVLVLSGGRWLINDIVYSNGQTLRQLLGGNASGN